MSANFNESVRSGIAAMPLIARQRVELALVCPRCHASNEPERTIVALMIDGHAYCINCQKPFTPNIGYVPQS